MPDWINIFAALTAAALLLAACATTPERNAVDLTKSPPQWASPHASNTAIATQWLSVFSNKELSALVQDALSQNYKLNAASLISTPAYYALLDEAHATDDFPVKAEQATRLNHPL
ncbi:MAG: hypothetical protein ACXWAT_03605 [Methylobacter sp.]